MIDTALKQQRLPAWQPVLTAKTVFPLFFGIGVVFIVLGAVLLNYSNLVSTFYSEKSLIACLISFPLFRFS